MKTPYAIALGVSLVAPLMSAEAQYRSQAATFTRATQSAPAITLSGTTPLLRYLSLDCDVDRMRGREAAGLNHASSSWMIGGVLSGVLLGLIGTAVVYAVASSSAVEVQSIPEGVEAACYRDGYVSRARAKNSSDALVGGLLGTAVLVLLVVAATSGSTY
jgi:hypothetical protein